MLSCQSVRAQHCPWQALTSLQLEKRAPMQFNGQHPAESNKLRPSLQHSPTYPQNMLQSPCRQQRCTSEQTSEQALAACGYLRAMQAASDGAHQDNLSSSRCVCLPRGQGA